MAAKIKAAKGVDAVLEKGGGGVFDVFKDDALVFSKKAVGRFPTNDAEVIDKLV